MVTGSSECHERPEKLAAQTRDLHRAIVSLREELEAIDWYQQRVDATEDAELKAILAHNHDEEKEHAAMLLEWIQGQERAGRFLSTTVCSRSMGDWRCMTS